MCLLELDVQIDSTPMSVNMIHLTLSYLYFPKCQTFPFKLSTYMTEQAIPGSILAHFSPD